MDLKHAVHVIAAISSTGGASHSLVHGLRATAEAGLAGADPTNESPEWVTIARSALAQLEAAARSGITNELAQAHGRIRRLVTDPARAT